MEYEFRRNSLDGSVQAIFTMDHEVLGRWVTDELGCDQQLITNIVQKIKAIYQGCIDQFRLVGPDLTLEIDTEQVSVYANVLAFEEDHNLEDSMSFYDSELSCCCGLEDFEHALLAWQTFLAEK